MKWFSVFRFIELLKKQTDGLYKPLQVISCLNPVIFSRVGVFSALTKP
jgi:hypothetical protein